MPEGPEVKTIVTNLQEEIIGAKIEEFIFHSDGKYRDKAPNNFLVIEKNLPLKIKNIKCKGKFIYFIFSDHFYMGNSLGMTGFWDIRDGKKRKHTCMSLVTDQGIYDFIDMRHFGCVHFFTDRADLDQKLKTIGPDFLNDQISEKEFIQRYKKKEKKNIAVALMDQSIVSGVGNYIKSESLYRAKISPHRTISDLSDRELSSLYDAIKKVSWASFKYNGMSQENYVDLYGEEGDYVNHLKVYGRKTDPKGNKIKKEKTKDGRSTFWVPDIQR